jgi:hypothetical protein
VEWGHSVCIWLWDVVSVVSNCNVCSYKSPKQINPVSNPNPRRVISHTTHPRYTLQYQSFVHEDSRRTIHELARGTVGTSSGVCQLIITESVNMSRIAAKVVPRILTNDQKQWAPIMCPELWEKANEDLVFMSRMLLFAKLKTKFKGLRFETLLEFRKE